MEGLENELWRIVIAEFILQPFRHFTYVTTHYPTLPSFYLRHSSFSNPSVASPTSQFISNPSFASPTSQALHLIYVTTHSPTLPSLYLRHSSFSNPSVASLTSQFIHQPFFRFSYLTSSSLNSPGEPPMGTCCTPVNKAMSEISNCFHYLSSDPCILRMFQIFILFSLHCECSSNYPV